MVKACESNQNKGLTFLFVHIFLTINEARKHWLTHLNKRFWRRIIKLVPNMDYPTNWTEYVDQKMNFITKHLDSFDFLCKDDLFYEKGLMSSVMQGMEKNGIQRHTYISKSIERSKEKRTIGNKLFTKKTHDEITHRKTFVYYTESIAAAPIDSEELSLGYSNRATLLCHLQKYKECLQDCDLALDAVKSDQLKVKLLFKKAEALIGLKDYIQAKDVLMEFNSLLENTNLSVKLMNMFSTKSQNFSKIIDSGLMEEDFKNESKESADELPVFEPSDEAPSASKALAINYNEEWGRHIVATRCIEPGELIVREKAYFSFIDPAAMYLFCSHCTKPSWNLIPCNGCVFDVYCSEECRQEARNKYHKYECYVFPYLCEKDSDIQVIFCHLRFMLIAVHNAGGLENLKEVQIAAQKSTDPRKKGFMDDGIFHSDQLRSCLSLPTQCEKVDYYESLLGSDVCYAVYYLATKTDFFGKKFDITPIKMVSETYMLFFAGLMFRHVFAYNSLKLKTYHSKGTIAPMGLSLYPFCSLFNNSCSSNTDFLFTEDNEVIVYANQPIEKDSQVFISYYQRDILLVPKNHREHLFKDGMKFQCKCIPCEENWSHICLPLLKDLLENAPDTLASIELMMKNLKNQMDQDFVYKKDLMTQVIKAMQVVAENATVNCEDYRQLGFIMKRIFVKSFGKKALPFPSSC